MASKFLKALGAFKQCTPFERGLAARLPEAYKKFYNEWRFIEPTAVHYVPEQGTWKRDEVTNEVFPIQNIPIPLKFPEEYDKQMWGGEGVVQGFVRKDIDTRRVPRFWVPHLQRSVVYSEVLNKHISVIITNRALSLINENYGFDHYLLKTPANDLKSLLPLKLKRKILQELQKGCPSYVENPQLQEEVYNKYKQYLSAYTTDEIEWYGYSLKEALAKMSEQLAAANKPRPLKNIYRSQLIEKLKLAEQEEASNTEVESSQTTWMQKINPFGKKKET
jgi:large subunit ribosomal protein L28